MAALMQLHRQPGSGIYHQAAQPGSGLPHRAPQPGTAQILINRAGAHDLQ